jgi:hypothetical protein
MVDGRRWNLTSLWEFGASLVELDSPQRHEGHEVGIADCGSVIVDFHSFDASSFPHFVLFVVKTSLLYK